MNIHSSSYTNHTFWFLGYAMNLENILIARNVFLENKV
jgi:hypothetical protein